MEKTLFDDYKTYKEIVSELMNPIVGNELDLETLTMLYESKLVYLEHIRLQCFQSINSNQQNCFTKEDLDFIVSAIYDTNQRLTTLIKLVISKSLKKVV